MPFELMKRHPIINENSLLLGPTYDCHPVLNHPSSNNCIIIGNYNFFLGLIIIENLECINFFLLILSNFCSTKVVVQFYLLSPSCLLLFSLIRWLNYICSIYQTPPNSLLYSSCIITENW